MLYRSAPAPALLAVLFTGCAAGPMSTGEDDACSSCDTEGPQAPVARAGEGLGSLEFGMPEERIADVFGAPDAEETFVDVPGELSSYKPELDLDGDGRVVKTYYKYSRDGFSVLAREGLVTTAFLYSGRAVGYEVEGDYSAFLGQLPFAMSFSSTESEVVAELGDPDRSGELSFAPVPSFWHEYSSVGVRLDFGKEDRVLSMVTIFAGMPAD